VLWFLSLPSYCRFAEAEWLGRGAWGGGVVGVASNGIASILVNAEDSYVPVYN
jgi:hypothetical protein